MRKIFCLILLMGSASILALNMGQYQAPVAARNYVAITPTGTITPGPILWVPWTGNPSGDSSSGSTVVQGTNPWVVANSSPTPQLQVNDPAGNTNWSTYLTPLAYTATPTFTPNAAANNYSRVTDLAAQTPVNNMSSILSSVASNASTAATAPSTAFGALGRYDSTSPTLTTGQSYLIPLDSRGNQRSSIFSSNGTTGALIRSSLGGGTIPNADSLFEVLGVNYVWGPSASYFAQVQVDGGSNTNTASGVAASAAPSYNFTPVTFTSTGSVTWGPFKPHSTTGTLQITTTGTITSATVTIQGSNDGTNFAALGTTNFTLTTFSGTNLLTWANLPSIYIRPLVTITTLGGTNIIINGSVGHP